ncbi:hypothetical protein GRI97_07710 [Altererythrobacter xixiisoli]|uniref:Transferrin-binding protein B C-lobe/N-lobe beta-barrel domain-containing protein n=1 Tax=Croceibacterium xixiisoli TaxID=1476466 RepID=A0A6I4TUH9_9SPHN|nr:transferrin-binding protein-like solute binding protein [Croceibacterium xixiisoli]MXO98870.1 hypothetical protein [Croceibacterium xixiisoli]
MDRLPLEISYDAARSTYSLSDGQRRVNFRSADIDRAQSNAELTTFKVTTGSTTDHLSVSTTGTGEGQTRYVAGGFWQTQTDGTAAIEGRLASFVYGIPTLASSVPRTGLAGYDVRLMGANMIGTSIASLVGDGRIEVDFQSGALLANGRYSAVFPDAPPPAWHGSQWHARALLSSGRFEGDITMDNYGTGDFHGSLFGPAGEEIGGAFHILGENSRITSGAIFGVRRDTPPVVVESFLGSVPDAFFIPLHAGIEGDLSNRRRISNIREGDRILSIHRASNIYTVFAANGEAVRLGSYQSYADHTNDYILDPWYRTPYVKYLERFDRRNGVAAYDAMILGIDTPASAMPRMGRAIYNATLGGYLMEPDAIPRNLYGEGVLAADFTTGQITGEGSYSVRALTSSSAWGNITDRVLDKGTWQSSAALGSGSNRFSGTMQLDGANDYAGSLTGGFFGPDASEAAGVFQLDGPDGRKLAGTVGSRFDDRATMGVTELADLSKLTLMTSISIDTTDGYSSDPTYINASSNAVYLDNTSEQFPLVIFRNAVSVENALLARNNATNTLDSSNDNPAFRRYLYSAPNFDQQVDAYVFDGQGGRIELTYSSFAVARRADRPGQEWTPHFIAYGVPTTAATLPRSGLASYSGVVQGYGYVGDDMRTDSYNLTGTSSMNVNFGSGKATSTLLLAGAHTQNGSMLDFGRYDFSGNITNEQNQVLIDGVADKSGYHGALQGLFFGAAAAEYGGIFNLTLNGHNGLYGGARGAFVGKKD